MQLMYFWEKLYWDELQADSAQCNPLLNLYPIVNSIIFPLSGPDSGGPENRDKIDQLLPRRKEVQDAFLFSSILVMYFMFLLLISFMWWTLVFIETFPFYINITQIHITTYIYIYRYINISYNSWVSFDKRPSLPCLIYLSFPFNIILLVYIIHSYLF